LAFFGRKKDEPTPTPPSPPQASNQGGSEGGGEKPPAPPSSPDGPGFSSENARKFFERAKTVHEATNYEYAMSLWLNGLRQDPRSMEGLKAFFESASAFLNSKDGAKGPSRDMMNQFSGKGEVDRYLGYLLAAGSKPVETSNWVRGAEIALKLGVREGASWLAQRGLVAAASEKKPRKDHYVSLMEILHNVEKFDLAVKAGEAAVRLDPTDGKLAQRVKNISAESTMTRGGYDSTGEAGGFRRNIKDASQQQRLEEEERIVKTEEVMDRLVTTSRAEYEAAPADRTAVRKYLERLLERGRPEDEKAAYEVSLKAYQETKEFAFKQRANAIKLKAARRKLEKLRMAAESAEADDVSRQQFDAFKKQLDDAEMQDLEERAQNYPSDLAIQFELGKKYFDTSRWEEAIAKFQLSKNDPKQRAKVLNYLGLSFQQIGWHDEAIETLRQAIEAHPAAGDDTGMILRYGLMMSLTARASDQTDLANAEEAYKIASSIAIQNISYKDIRARREELKQLVARLKQG
jgi:tetratricopeptide (TPR) repeat protein